MHPVLTFVCLAVILVAPVMAYTAFIFLSQEWAASENLYRLTQPKQRPGADLKSVLRGAAGSIITEIIPDLNKTVCSLNVVEELGMLKCHFACQSEWPCDVGSP